MVVRVFFLILVQFQRLDKLKIIQILKLNQILYYTRQISFRLK